MLELLLGTDWTVNTDEILRRISGDVAAERGGRILLVPELISHDMERRLCAAAGDTASRFAEVLSFTRLAQRVSDSMGVAALECLDEGGRVVAMASAARQLHSRLKAYASVETKPEFLLQLVEAVDEFKRCCISASDLQAASERTEGAFAQKLSELALLMEAYDALCRLGKRDPRDQMTWVLEQLEEGDFAGQHCFYIDGFPDLTRQNLAIVDHFIRYAPMVTVSLNCDEVGSKRLAFEKAGETAAELVRCARQAGVEVKITVLPGRKDALDGVCQRLFQGEIRQNPGLEKHLRLYTAGAVWQECELAGAEILRRVRGGARYRDMSLVCTDMEAYRPVISLVFRRMGIPVYLSGTEDILDKSAIATVLSAMEAALEGFEQKTVLRYLRSVLSPIDGETCDEVENYATVWAISGVRWKQPFTEHPDGLSGKWNKRSQQRLERIEQGRKTAIAPLLRLQQGFRDATSLADQVRAVYALLEDLQLAERLGELARNLDEGGDGRSAQILNQLWEILITALEQLYDVLGATAWDPEAFQRLFVLLLSQYDVGTIPTVLDAVTVGPVSAMRCQREKHLFVLGASEGLLPGYGGSDGVLTDQERIALRNMEIPLTGGALEGIQAEFAEVYGVFRGASETVTVSCSGDQPSYVYRRLRDMVGVETEQSKLPTATSAFDAACYLAQFDAREQAEGLGLSGEYDRVDVQRNYDLGAISQENVQRLYGGGLMMSASQVDRQAECRLSYFLKYGLSARERKEATVDPAEFGTYVHFVLEHTARRVMEKGGFHQVSVEDTLALAKEYSDAYAQEHFRGLDSQRAAYLFRRNMRELDLVVRELWEELSAGGYEPVEFELHFGKDGKLPPIDIGTPAMAAQLQGYVDRVDCFRTDSANFFRVVDYKTGSKDFDYCDVFNGVGLQMLLYLFALEQEGADLLGEAPVPGGVQYFPARVNYVSLDGAVEDETAQRRKNWKRQGLLLSDDRSLEAMDPDLGRLCCDRKKDGTLSGDLADRGQLRLLRRYVFQVLAAAVEDIASGNVTPNPYTRGSSHDACAYCPYGAICHKQSVEGRRNYKAMSAVDFWTRIGREVDDRG